MPRADYTETFTEMRDRLMQVHGWGRKIATLAARYYLGVENCDDLRARTQDQPCLDTHRHGCVVARAYLTLAQAHEIVMLR